MTSNERSAFCDDDAVALDLHDADGGAGGDLVAARDDIDAAAADRGEAGGAQLRVP